MNKPESYEDVMKLLEQMNDMIENGEIVLEELPDGNDFKFEYAHESLTERHSVYRVRASHA